MGGFELRATVLGHVVRGAPPTAFDRVLATRLGVGALTSLAEGVPGVLIGEQRGEITRTPLAEIAGKHQADFHRTDRACARAGAVISSTAHGISLLQCSILLSM
jgi:6-phosphofructokinase